MRSARDPLRVVLVLFLLASAVIFAVGTSIERGRSEAGHETAVSSNEGTSESSGEGSTAESPPASLERSGETIFGINPDSAWLVALVVAVTLLLAVAIWAVASPGCLLRSSCSGSALRSSTCASSSIRWMRGGPP